MKLFLQQTWLICAFIRADFCEMDFQVATFIFILLDHHPFVTHD